MKIEELNSMTAEEAFIAFEMCCGSKSWIQAMVGKRPYPNEEDLMEFADEQWENSSDDEIKEAFLHHPKIGDINSLTEKYANTKGWAGEEQSSVQGADSNVIKELAEWNQKYEDKFGYIFIVCATGKSAIEMLQLIKNRMINEHDNELMVAAKEQMKITHIRLHKLLE